MSSVITPGTLVLPRINWAPVRMMYDSNGAAIDWSATTTRYPSSPGMVISYDEYLAMCYVLTEWGLFWTYVHDKEIVHRWEE